MGTVSVRELADNTSRVVREVSETGRPQIITNRGVPVAAIVPIDVTSLEDFILSTAPAFVRAMRAADEDMKAGEAVPLAEPTQAKDAPDT